MGGGKKVTSWNFYYCPYILRTGEVCNRRCYDPKGCKVHRNSRQIPCKECGKQTKSGYDYCRTPNNTDITHICSTNRTPLTSNRGLREKFQIY